ncbi:MAG TPA: hypothetical protein VM791_12855 [Vicinamibacterales bacterium]|nr:hypothetical protein [Vicinamibacterales bacterium]
MSDYEIRRAAPEHLDALGRLGALLMRVHYEFDRKRFMHPGSHAEAGYGAFLATQLDDPESLVLVAVHDGEVRGYVYEPSSRGAGRSCATAPASSTTFSSTRPASAWGLPTR